MQTGDRVKWSIDGKTREGIFRQDLGNTAEIICTSFEGVPMALKCTVEKKLLSLD
jgi:hypothetical protein